MKKKYESELLGVIHQSAQDLYEIGAISEARMREYDEDCLVSEPKTAKAAHKTQPPILTSHRPSLRKGRLR
jgi:DNA-binding transcriptional regulator YiaG